MMMTVLTAAAAVVVVLRLRPVQWLLQPLLRPSLTLWLRLL